MSFNLYLIFLYHFVCPSSILLKLSIIFTFTILHSISLFCTDEIALFTNLGLIDMFSANQTAEIVACILLINQTINLICNYSSRPLFQSGFWL